MATYYFQLVDHDGVQPTEMSYEFDTPEAAIEEGRTALAEMAADGLPLGDYHMLSVEVFDHQRKPVREIRLILEEIDRTVPAHQSALPEG
ncbi:hypothetical protein [Rhizobium sp. Root1220]|uniref:DUF6894 family protein n=1 Tax=Rhizobium sp. Root1220 TaxID=1736432 RepID=UPI0006FCAE4A|nr:hypothetical protein [Rhizobium sp. Root1220]KQV82132.1 hypothetical protein ASC90_23770 [Rhizobium sp. Root1220]